MAAIDTPGALTDGTITLRPWTRADVPWLARAAADPEVSRWTGIPRGCDEALAEDWIVMHEAQRATGWGVPFAITDAATSKQLGSMALEHVRASVGVAEVGYWVAAEARGRGVATRALRRIAKYAFDDLRLARLEIPVHVENAASRRVAERAGAHLDGVLRSARVLNGSRVDVALYSLLPGEIADVEVPLRHPNLPEGGA